LQLPVNLQTALDADLRKYWRALDIAYCVSLENDLRRNEGRRLVIDAYIMSGGESYLRFNPSANAVDLVDLCIVDQSFMEYL
jgi:hypothetical protein